MPDLGNDPDLARAAARFGVGKVEDVPVVIEGVGIRLLLEAEVFDIESGRRPLVIPEGEVERFLDVAHDRYPVGQDLSSALVFVVLRLEEIAGELLGQPCPGHAEVPAEEKDGRTR